MLVSRDWAADLAPLGLTPVEEIGSGMEGVVLRLEGDLVAKVWHDRGARPTGRAAVGSTPTVADALPLRATRILTSYRSG